MDVKESFENKVGKVSLKVQSRSHIICDTKAFYLKERAGTRVEAKNTFICRKGAFR